MFNRFIRAYAYALLGLVGVLATAALLAHVWWLITGQEENQPAKTLFFASILGNIFALAFLTDKTEWTKQVKACPKWMYRTVFGLGIYAIALACIELAFGERPASWFTSFPLAVDAIAFGLLYAALRRGYLANVEKRELRNHIAWSWAIVGFVCGGAVLHLIRK